MYVSQTKRSYICCFPIVVSPQNKLQSTCVMISYLLYTIKITHNHIVIIIKDIVVFIIFCIRWLLNNQHIFGGHADSRTQTECKPVSIARTSAHGLSSQVIWLILKKNKTKSVDFDHRNFFTRSVADLGPAMTNHISKVHKNIAIKTNIKLIILSANFLRNRNSTQLYFGVCKQSAISFINSVDLHLVCVFRFAPQFTNWLLHLVRCGI